MEVKAFLAAVDSIVDSQPTYRLGGTGEDGTCDCIGLVMGAMQRTTGARFALHSSNYFARWQMGTLLAVTEADGQVVPGCIVFKARPDTGELHERYKNGGAYYNGDTRDFYHAGVVVAVDPMEIKHCTSSNGVNGIATDTDISVWTHVGQAKAIDYGADGAVDMQTVTAYVSTPDGNRLNLRPSPSTEKSYIAKIPNGSKVQVYADADGWAKVSWRGMMGYCMSGFIRYANQPLDSGSVQLPRELAQQLLDAIAPQIERG